MMAIPLQQLIMEAKRLSSKLKEDESKSDTIISSIKSTQRQIEHMKQYSDDLEVENEAASQRSQSALVADLQKETQQLRELEAENRELRAALDDYQNALELIMSKYRQQMSRLMAESHNDVSTYYNATYSKIMMEQCHRINEMREVMHQAAEADEEQVIKDRQLISQLVAENKGLREMFNIFTKYGRQHPGPPEEAEGSNDSNPAQPST